jgi:hypothetical protein
MILINLDMILIIVLNECFYFFQKNIDINKIYILIIKGDHLILIICAYYILHAYSQLHLIPKNPNLRYFKSVYFFLFNALKVE